MQKILKASLKKLREIKPLVLCLTNYVTMDFMANSLLALGAAPIMSCDERELEELIQMSHAVNINIGTLNADFIERCKRVTGKPIVLDPVGAGASIVRTQSARELMVAADIIRGNASEIMALLENENKTLGVESMHQVNDAKNSANKLAEMLKCTVVISGEEDFITNGIKQQSLNFGSPVMPLITGMGCTLTAVIAAFRAVIPDAFEAALVGTAYFGMCGSSVHKKTNKPGSFRTAFIDELYSHEL